MCWFSKPRPTPEPPSAGRLALPATKSPPMFSDNTTSASTEEPGNGPVEFLCNPPAERCANTSAKYDGYCVNGICCHNKLLRQEFCACYHQKYTGDRCDIDELDLELIHASPDENMPIIVTVIVIVVLLVTAIVIFIVCRRRRNRMSRSRQNGGVEHSVQFLTTASDTAAKGKMVDCHEDNR